MTPRIEEFRETRIVGSRLPMSFANDRTHELWRSFKPRLSEVENRMGNDLYSVQVLEIPDTMREYDLEFEFDKWAGVPVERGGAVPEGMEELVIPAGQYAVFHYKGKPSEAQATFQYIFLKWLPDSEYTLDDRPHMAIMGEKYKGEDPDSEEEFWIPVRRKS